VDRRRVGLILLVVGVLGLQTAGFHGLRHDDAFITYRYGQNLARGAGPVFNPGERVQGSTSPAQLLLAAGLYRVVGEAALPSAMSALGCLGWTAQAIALFWMLSRKGDVGTALFIALAVAAGAARSFDWVALETDLVMALVLWACALAFAARWVAVAVCCALAGLTRPDAYLLAVPLGIWCLRELGWRAWIPAAVGLGLSAPWWLFAAWYYGSPIPHTAVATFQVVGFARYARHLLVVPPDTIGLSGSHPATLAVGWGLALVGAVVLIRRDVRLAVLAAYGLLQAAAYLYLRPFSARNWHDYPLILAFTVFALGALAAAVHLVARTLRTRRVAGAVLGLVVLFFGWRSYTFAQEYPHQRWLGARDAVYRQIAAHLRQYAAPGDVVVTGEVGTLAYYSDLPMHDLTGLVTLDPGRVVRPGPDWLATDRVPRLRWAVLYPHAIPPSMAGTAWIRSVGTGAFQVYLVDLGTPRGGSPARAAAPRP
jgi:arabinofuranosyltransferase